MSDTPVNFDVDIARHFLSAVDPGGVFTFQTIDDDKDRKASGLARVFHGSIDQHLASLTSLNQQGAGVFVMVNAGDSKGRTAASVQRVRALFVDLDGAPLDPVLQCALPQHIVVDSSAGRFHAYWLVSDVPLEDFKPLQQKLAMRFGGDSSVCDLPRVMRLPGFQHRKGEPTLTALRSIGTHSPYSVAQLVHGLGLSEHAHSVNAGA